MKNNKLIFVFLGNNSKELYKTRHNISWLFADFIAKKNAKKFQEKDHYYFFDQKIMGTTIFFIKLKTLMNNSGKILKKILQEQNWTKEQLIIFADNIDVETKKIKGSNSLQQNGHNGISDIIEQLQTKKIKTFYFGIDRQKNLRHWVLSEFKNQELLFFEETLFPKTWKILQTMTDINSLKNWKQKWHHLWKEQKQKLPHIAIVGGQWGDEGKGKIVDYLTKDHDIIARFAGGDNAGHTVCIGEKKYHFSILPVSILQEQKTSIIGSGCVINLQKLNQEIDNLKEQNKKINLKISSRAHVILPIHLHRDLEEEQKRVNQIGTTKRGIGPCYQDRVKRCGVRLQDFIKTFPKNEQKFSEYWKWYSKIEKYLDDTFTIVQKNKKEKKILFEGAQGTLLDLNFGAYPFVTSSRTITWEIGNSFGNILKNTKLLGVFKAYSTRVGAGPMVTEFDNTSKIGSHIVTKGHEFGVVTKRKRRVGWFDGLLAKYACDVNGFEGFALTMIDVLSNLDKIKICTHYQVDGVWYDTFRNDFFDHQNIKCRYLEFDGWKENLQEIKNYHDLPINAKKYIKEIQKILKIPLLYISVGPKRNQIIDLKNDLIK